VSSRVRAVLHRARAAVRRTRAAIARASGHATTRHLLGGPHPGNRGALASATVSRHPAVALLLASGAFPEQEATVIGAVLLYLLTALLLAVPYERWRKSVISV